MSKGEVGSCSGYNYIVLFAGGNYATNGVIGIFTSADSKEDKMNIVRGINWYRSEKGWPLI